MDKMGVSQINANMADLRSIASSEKNKITQCQIVAWHRASQFGELPGVMGESNVKNIPVDSYDQPGAIHAGFVHAAPFVGYAQILFNVCQ